MSKKIYGRQNGEGEEQDSHSRIILVLLLCGEICQRNVKPQKTHSL